MHYHIGNVFCVVVRNFHGWIFQVHNQISTITMLALPKALMNITHISHCTVHVRRPFNEDKQCQLCNTSTYAIVTAKLHDRKYLIMME